MFPGAFLRTFLTHTLGICLLASLNGQVAAEPSPAETGTAPIVADTVFRNGDWLDHCRYEEGLEVGVSRLMLRFFT